MNFSVTVSGRMILYAVDPICHCQDQWLMLQDLTALFLPLLVGHHGVWLATCAILLLTVQRCGPGCLPRTRGFRAPTLLLSVSCPADHPWAYRSSPPDWQGLQKFHEGKNFVVLCSGFDIFEPQNLHLANLAIFLGIFVLMCMSSNRPKMVANGRIQN